MMYNFFQNFRALYPQFKKKALRIIYFVDLVSTMYKLQYLYQTSFSCLAEMGKKLGYFSSLVIFFAFIYLQKSHKNKGETHHFLPTWSAEEFVGNNHALAHSSKDIRVYHLLAGYINMLVYTIERGSNQIFFWTLKKKIHATHDVIAFLRDRHVCSTKIRLTYLILNSVSNLTEEKAQKIPFKKYILIQNFSKEHHCQKWRLIFGQISLDFNFVYQRVQNGNIDIYYFEF